MSEPRAYQLGHRDATVTVTEYYPDRVAASQRLADTFGLFTVDGHAIDDYLRAWKEVTEDRRFATQEGA